MATTNIEIELTLPKNQPHMMAYLIRAHYKKCEEAGKPLGIYCSRCDTIYENPLYQEIESDISITGKLKVAKCPIHN